MSVAKKMKTTNTYFDQALICLKNGEYDNIVELLIKSTDSDDEDKGYSYWMLAKASKYGLWGTERDISVRGDLIFRGARLDNMLCLISQNKSSTQMNFSHSGYTKDGWDSFAYARYQRCVKRNHTTCLMYLGSAAHINNNMFAQYKLSRFSTTYNGDSTKLLVLAARQGHWKAQYDYVKVLCGSKHKIEQFKWLKKTVLQGYRNQDLLMFIVNYDYNFYSKLEIHINAVVYILCVGKYNTHIISYDVAKIIAKFVYATKNDKCWNIDTPQSRKVKQTFRDLNLRIKK
jgi:hypothetical protein